jgi:hypothetical protein
MGVGIFCRDSLNFELCSLKFELVTCARTRQQGEHSIKTMTYNPRSRAAGLRTLLATQRFLTTIVPQNVTTGIQSRVNPGDRSHLSSKPGKFEQDDAAWSYQVQPMHRVLAGDPVRLPDGTPVGVFEGG